MAESTDITPCPACGDRHSPSTACTMDYQRDNDSVTWEGLDPPYATIVADPPWHYEQGGTYTGVFASGLRPPPYASMSVDEIAALKVGLLADGDSHLYLWTTNAYLRDAFDIVDAWGFRHSQTLTWCKSPRGIGPGGAFSNTTEFVLFCRHGSLKPAERIDSTWWEWKRGAHSVKPAGFYDIVERVSPGPYLELFARQPRLGWDAWGYGIEGVASKRVMVGNGTCESDAKGRPATERGPDGTLRYKGFNLNV